jgi:hypothetical protein
MMGDILYPLNEMKDTLPEVYKKAVLKYEGRERIMQDVIPILGCLWNDVLHFSPVHPSQVLAEFLKSGKELMGREYFEIPAEMFSPDKTVIYLNGELPKMDPKNWLPYDSALVEKYSEIPELTKAYYKEKFAKNEQPLLYAKIPHILYKGSIDTKNIKRIKI